MEDFEILSYEEEKKLSTNEKLDYYKKLRSYLKNMPTTKINDFYMCVCNALNKKFVRGVINLIKGYELTVTGQENIPNGPVIYATTHQDFNDHFSIVLSIPEHAIILNTINVSKIFKIIMGVNGIVYVDRNNKENRFNSKLKLMKYISKGKSVVVFPEGTYNCSPNKLHLPLHSGVLDMARKMGVPIVPVVQEYNYDTLDNKKSLLKSCHVHFGRPIYVTAEDSLKDKKEELSTAFATIRFKLIEEKGLYNREALSNVEYINQVKSIYKTWEMANVDKNEERKTIYGYNDEFYLFHHINDVSINSNNELMPTNYVIELEKIYKKNLHKF